MKAGEKIPLLSADVGNSALEIQIDSYMALQWSAKGPLEKEPQQLTVWSFDAVDKGKKVTMVRLIWS